MQNNNTHVREQFSSRLGFLLITAGCAIGLGNVWRFPYITGQYGGAAFVLIYLLFLVILGIPLVSIELAIGRASRKSIGCSFETLTPNKKWYLCKYFMICGNYLLMAFYTMVTGWMLYYSYRMIKGDFTVEPLTQSKSSQYFGELLASPGAMILCTVLVTVFAFSICALGLKKGVERITKPLMVILILLLITMAVRSFTLDGFSEGITFYLKPDLAKLENNFVEAIWAAMGQAFFTLSVGFGAIAIFGSYMSERHKILNEAIFIALFDTIVAFLSGLVIFPACFTYGISPDAGPNLLYLTMTVVFSHMTFGTFWGSLFFLFMLIAAISTMIAVFESSIAGTIELLKVKRLTAVIINFVVIITLCLLPLLGYNLLSDVKLINGRFDLLGFFDFLVSNNIMPIGSLVFVLFVVSKSGMKFEKYIEECNIGKGFNMSLKLKNYYRFILTPIVTAVLLFGYYSLFF